MTDLLASFTSFINHWAGFVDKKLVALQLIGLLTKTMRKILSRQEVKGVTPRGSASMFRRSQGSFPDGDVGGGVSGTATPKKRNSTGKSEASDTGSGEDSYCSANETDDEKDEKEKESEMVETVGSERTMIGTRSESTLSDNSDVQAPHMSVPVPLIHVDGRASEYDGRRTNSESVAFTQSPNTLYNSSPEWSVDSLIKSGVPHLLIFLNSKPFHIYFVPITDVTTMVFILAVHNYRTAHMILKSIESLREGIQIIQSLLTGGSGGSGGSESETAEQLNRRTVERFAAWKNSSTNAKILAENLHKLEKQQQASLSAGGSVGSGNGSAGKPVVYSAVPETLLTTWAKVTESVARAEKDIRERETEDLREELLSCIFPMWQLLLQLHKFFKASRFFAASELSALRANRPAQFCQFFSFLQSFLVQELDGFSGILVVKAERNLPLSSYFRNGSSRFQGLLHLLIVNRSTNRLYSPRLSLREFVGAQGAGAAGTHSPNWFAAGSAGSAAQRAEWLVQTADFTPELLSNITVGLHWFLECLSRDFSYGRLERRGCTFVFQVWQVEADGAQIVPAVSASGPSVPTGPTGPTGLRAGPTGPSHNSLQFGQPFYVQQRPRDSPTRFQVLTVHVGSVPLRHVHQQHAELVAEHVFIYKCA